MVTGVSPARQVEPGGQHGCWQMQSVEQLVQVSLPLQTPSPQLTGWHFWTQDFQVVPQSRGSRHQVLPGTAWPLQQLVMERVSSQPPEGMQPLTGAVPQT